MAENLVEYSAQPGTAFGAQILCISPVLEEASFLLSRLFFQDSNPVTRPTRRRSSSNEYVRLRICIDRTRPFRHQVWRGNSFLINQAYVQELRPMSRSTTVSL
jgi:hypothetical protein